MADNNDKKVILIYIVFINNDSGGGGGGRNSIDMKSDIKIKTSIRINTTRVSLRNNI